MGRNDNVESGLEKENSREKVWWGKKKHEWKLSLKMVFPVGGNNAWCSDFVDNFIRNSKLSLKMVFPVGGNNAGSIDSADNFTRNYKHIVDLGAL